MSGMPRVDTAVLAASVVGMADQIMKGVKDNRDHHGGESRSHYVKAAIAGAIAIGAFEMLKNDEHLDDGEHPHHKHHHGKHQKEDGHTKDLVEEALGAYSLGRQMLGHKEHRILKLVAEGLGAAALAKEVDRDLIED